VQVTSMASVNATALAEALCGMRVEQLEAATLARLASIRAPPVGRLSRAQMRAAGAVESNAEAARKALGQRPSAVRQRGCQLLVAVSLKDQVLACSAEDLRDVHWSRPFLRPGPGRMVRGRFLRCDAT
jgi:hypothetical protein